MATFLYLALFVCGCGRSLLYALFVAAEAYSKNYIYPDFGYLLYTNSLSIIGFLVLGHCMKRSKDDLTRRAFTKNFWIIALTSPILFSIAAPPFIESQGGMFALALLIVVFMFYYNITIIGIALQLVDGGKECELRGDDPLMGALVLYSAYSGRSLGFIYLLFCAGDDLVRRRPKDAPSRFGSDHSSVSETPASPEKPMGGPTSPQMPPVQPPGPQMPAIRPTSPQMPPRSP